MANHMAVLNRGPVILPPIHWGLVALLANRKRAPAKPIKLGQPGQAVSHKLHVTLDVARRFVIRNRKCFTSSLRPTVARKSKIALVTTAHCPEAAATNTNSATTPVRRICTLGAVEQVRCIATLVQLELNTAVSQANAGLFVRLTVRARAVAPMLLNVTLLGPGTVTINRLVRVAMFVRPIRQPAAGVTVPHAMARAQATIMRW